ncbi:MAG TPA: DinB family protein [Bryobacteraceae bacterium]|nr:DinB family protein [Bryobacteraceae bacterium]HXR78952.1 DinB family protein [Bryobacteraceae bacterium]
MSVIGRPQENEFSPHAKVYVGHVYSDDLIQVLADQIRKTVALLRPLDEERALLSYAPGKWTVKQTIGHLSDTERILSCRILRIARGDTTPLPGFEQDEYVPNAGSNERSLENLLQEFVVVRESTLALVRGLPPEAWSRRGTTSGLSVTVRGLAFTLAGHELHHFKILEDRYLRASPTSST